MVRKVAIIQVYESYDNDGYSYDTIVRSITDWTEISDEDFKLLKKAESMQCKFRVLEQPIDTKEFIANTVSDYIRQIKEAEELAAKEKQRKADIAREKALKKLANNDKKKRELFEQLKTELGEK